MRRVGIGDRRGISKEGVAALGFAMTVAMIGITGGILMQSEGLLQGDEPIMTASAGPVDASNSMDGQWLRIRHESGDEVDVRNLTIEVWIPSHRKRATLRGLPTDSLRQSDYEGNHVFTIGPRGVAGAATASGTDETWSAGEVIALRIEPRRVDLKPGETVQVTVRHEPTATRLYRATVEVG